MVPDRRAVANILWCLTALFAVRVLGQALQLWVPIASLPSFEQFQGSHLPYSVLLPAQLLILGLMVRGAWFVRSNEAHVGAKTRQLLTWLGGIYLAGSISRIAIGLAVPSAPSWFRAPISEIFHLVLAGYVLVLARVRAPCPRDLAKETYA